MPAQYTVVVNYVNGDRKLHPFRGQGGKAKAYTFGEATALEPNVVDVELAYPGGQEVVVIAERKPEPIEPTMQEEPVKAPPKRSAKRSTKRTLTAEEREAKREANAAMMKEAVGKLLTSEGWQQWLKVRRSFHRYSLGNQLLIMLQYPDATMVAGFRKWLTLNRVVMSRAARAEQGLYEYAIKVWVPMQVKDYEKIEQRKAAGTYDPTNPPKKLIFKLGNVFDVSQTEQIEGAPVIDLEPPSREIEGDSHEPYIARLEAYAASLGYTIEHKRLRPGVGGYHDKASKVIALSNLKKHANSTLRTLIHELAHAHDLGYDKYTRGQAECMVETITYLVCQTIGLDTGGESVPYVGGWDGSGDGLAALEVYATTIHEVARKIEDALL